jgi:general secretion pathway protein K
VQPNEKGFVLITVLLVIAVLFPLILAFNAKVQLNLIQAGNFRDSVQGLRLARSGVEAAIGILKADDPNYDSKSERWAQPFPPLSLNGGILAVEIVDEDGKIPINNLVGFAQESSVATNPGAATSAPQTAGQTAGTATSQTAVDQVDQDLNTRLRSLITQLGGKPEIVDALIDWLDSDDTVTGEEGAEEDYYKQRGYHCKNGPLDSLDELLLVRGFDKELLVDRKLQDYLTVAPTDGKINVNTAPLPVLYAVLGTKTASLGVPLNQSDVQNLARYRDTHDLKAERDVALAVQISQTQVAAITPLIKVNSAYFTVNSRYTIGRVVKHVEALLKRAGSTVATVSWRDF